MKIALCQINPLVADFKRQYATICSACDQARSAGADLAVFPELALSGYPPRDLLERPDFVEANRGCLERLIDTVRGIGVICGFVERNPNSFGKPLFNSAALFENGKILHRIRKQIIPARPEFDEQRFFEPGGPSEPCTYKGRRIGLTICEDAWHGKTVPGRRTNSAEPVERLLISGADLLINIAAAPFYSGSRASLEALLASTAGSLGIPLVFVNQVGGHDNLLFEGSSTVWDSHGSTAARARAFSGDMICFDTDSGRGDIHSQPLPEIEATLQALTMGTRDYVTKSGFKQVVIGSSGGVDSALVIYIAVQALGAANVATVLLPSRHTSAESCADARQLAHNLGVACRTIPIDDLYYTFASVLVPDADPARPGITEQNLQARIRGTLLMGISNRDGCMLLTTGNKSELAAGYCTLYGDMNGGLAVIADVPKTLVYEICRWINREREIIPHRIVERAPSAELAPNQTDQDDLPPYPQIDPIVKGYVEELLSPAELAAAGHDAVVVAEVVGRIDRNEYKRYQAAPGLKITARAFSEGRRYPLAKNFNPL